METTLQEGITNVKDLVGDAVSNITNPFVSAIGGAVVGSAIAGGVALAVSKNNKRRKKAKSKRKNSRKRNNSNRKRRRKSKIKYARTAGKGKDTSHKRIRMTKNGQPYIIQANGRARFISKSSARRSRKLKGGRY